MRWILASILLSISTWSFADAKVIEMSGVEYLETGEEVFKRVKDLDLKEGEQVILQDKYNPQTKTKAEILKVMDNAVILKTVK